MGYRKPPDANRFAKGQSGNPRGRPKGRMVQPPYETVLGQKVMVREGGRERRLSAAEAFLLHITRRGLEGDGQAARVAMNAIEEARARRSSLHQDGITTVVFACVVPGSVTPALAPLKMGRKLDPYRETVRVKLEPWLVQAALARLGDRQLSVAEQVTVMNATRTPSKVIWPTWWAGHARFETERKAEANSSAAPISCR